MTMILRKLGDDFLYGNYGSASPYALAMFTDPNSGYGAVALMNTWRVELRFAVSDMILEYMRQKNGEK